MNVGGVIHECVDDSNGRSARWALRRGGRERSANGARRGAGRSHHIRSAGGEVRLGEVHQFATVARPTSYPQLGNPPKTTMIKNMATGKMDETRMSTRVVLRALEARDCAGASPSRLSRVVIALVRPAA